MIAIDRLYIGGCPAWKRTWIELGHALTATATNATVRQGDIDSLPERERIGFAGSPTLRIDGRDRNGYEGPAVTSCRRYESNAGKGRPSQAVIQGQLRVASRKDGKGFA
jgi:hypothetical protein